MARICPPRVGRVGKEKVRPLSSWSGDMQPHIDNSQGCTPDMFVMTVITKSVDMYPK